MKIFGRLVGSTSQQDTVLEFSGSEVIKTEYRTAEPTEVDYFFPTSTHLIFPGFVDICAKCQNETNVLETYETASLAALNGGIIQLCDISGVSHHLFTKTAFDILHYIRLFEHSELLEQRMPYLVDSNVISYTSLINKLHDFRGQNITFRNFASIEQILDLIAQFNLQGKISPVSTADQLSAILHARRSGLKVAMEVSPYQLYFDSSMMTHENSKFLANNPPVGTPDDRGELMRAFKLGSIEYLVSDHNPRSVSEKLEGALGMPNLDTFGSFIAHLIKNESVAPEVIYMTACVNPGSWVRHFSERQFEKEASFTVLDFSRSAAESRPLYSKSAWSPFDLRCLPGAVDTVFVRGKRAVGDIVF
jgi:dihydroorotase-like cyclic amidohydrolase